MARFFWRLCWTCVAMGTVLMQAPSFWRASATAYRRAMNPPERRCTCFGDSGMHASTHSDGVHRCCDMCGWPIQEDAVDVLTAVNSMPPPEPKSEAK